MFISTLSLHKTIISRQQLSQFWYNERTKRLLADVCRQCLPASPASSLNIALLSCPSLYDHIRAANPAGLVHLFEFDERFVAYGSDYVHFDYKLAGADAADYLAEFHGLYDLLIVDPPFLAAECIEKMSHIVRRLRKPPPPSATDDDDTDASSSTSGGKVILCSGRVVADWALEFMQLRPCAFHPEHERNLGNEFGSFANFDLDGCIAKATESGVLLADIVEGK